MAKFDDFKRDSNGVRKLGVYRRHYTKSDEEPGQMEDLAALLDVNIEQVRARRELGGKHPAYENSPEGLRDLMEATQQYFQYIKDANAVNESKLIPDIEGWCIFCGVTRQTMSTYMKRGDEWEEGIRFIKDSILATKKQLAFRFKIPPVVYLNDVSNNHDYLNTSEFKLISQTTTSDDRLSPAYSMKEIMEAYETRKAVIAELEREGRLLPSEGESGATEGKKYGSITQKTMPEKPIFE